MITIINRAPNDHFTYELFQQLLTQVPVDFEAYYMWPSPPDDFKKFVTETTFCKPIVILGIKDLLDLWLEFDYWNDIVTAGTQLLANMAQRNLDKTFVVFTSNENLKAELDRVGVTNIQLIEWGGDLVNQSELYPTVNPVWNKNFDSISTFVSLNRHPRAHRLVALSYLFGQGYHHSGYITYIGQDQFDLPDSILDQISWQFDQQHDLIRQSILDGYKEFYRNKKLQIIEYQNIYTTTNGNVDNFINRLTPVYRNSFVEIVTESSFGAPAYLLTEKVLNSIYGCNFPIVLSGVGAIAHLREIGFDMFDDIVDHSYDQIANPFDRIVGAIENNRQLLLDADHAKQCWKQCQHRFMHNVDLAKSDIYHWYRQRAINQFNNIHWE